MSWTTTPPTQPGFYWYRDIPDGNIGEVVELVEYNTGNMWWHRTGTEMLSGWDEMEGGEFWPEPLTPPPSEKP